MREVLALSAVVGLATVLLALGLELLARGRSAAFRHALWTVASATLVATPAVLALVGGAGEALVTGSPREVPSWTPVEPRGGYDLWVAAWAIPAGLLALRSVLGWILAARLARRARPVLEGVWCEEAERSALRLGLGRVPRLALSEAVPGPAVVGLLRPILLLPPDVLDAPATDRRAILDHELAHVVRRDVLATRLAAMARALHWYNPLAWWAAIRLDLAAECACDDAVLRGGLGPGEYARILARASGVRRPAPAFAGAGFGTAPIVKRVEALAAREGRRGALGRGDLLILAAALMLAVAPLVAASSILAQRPGGGEVLLLPPGAVYSFTPEDPGLGGASLP